jgi:hypothetical protein
MELYIPTTWLVLVLAGLGVALVFFLIGRACGRRVENKKWLAFIEAQCRMSFGHSQENPLESILAERSAARERRLHRRDER